jgi:hypothetical protein
MCLFQTGKVPSIWDQSDHPVIWMQKQIWEGADALEEADCMDLFHLAPDQVIM